MYMELKNQKVPLKLSRTDYQILAQEITTHLEKRFKKIDREIIEGIVYRQVIIETEKIRQELLNMIKEEIKIQKKKNG